MPSLAVAVTDRQVTGVALAVERAFRARQQMLERASPIGLDLTDSVRDERSWKRNAQPIPRLRGRR